MKPFPTSIEEKETLAQRAVSLNQGKEELVRIWRVTSHPLLQTKTLRATGLFKSTSRCCQFVCMEHMYPIHLIIHSSKHKLLKPLGLQGVTCNQ